MISIRRKNALLVMCVINFYFVSSFFLREAVESYLGVEFFALIDSSISLVDWLVLLLNFFVGVYIYQVKDDSYLIVSKPFNRLDSMFVLVVSVILYLLVLAFFKKISSDLSYEGFHKFLNETLWGKLLYVLLFCVSIQLYYVLNFDNKFLKTLLFFQLLLGVALSEMRSFIMFNLISLYFIPSVSVYVNKNIFKVAIIVCAALLLPIFFRSGTTNVYFVLSQILVTGAFQYDLFVAVSQNITYKVSDSYVESGGGYGNFILAYMFDYIGYISILFWCFLPVFIKNIPMSLLGAVSIYYFTIVRNHPSSWLNGIVFLVFVGLIYGVLPKYEKKNIS